MYPELKLRLMKTLINVPVRVLDKLLKMPENAMFPQTKMLLRTHEIMTKAYRLDCAQGTFGETPDGNFSRFLNVTAKLLANISEKDRYYRAWLGLTFILARREIDKFNMENAKEIKRLIKVQWLDDVDFLSDNVILSDKRDFSEIALCDYLANLARMEPAECEFPRNV